MFDISGYTLTDIIKLIISTIVTQFVLWGVPAIFKNFISFYIKIILFLKKIHILVIAKYVIFLIVLGLIYLFMRNFLALIIIFSITLIIFIIIKIKERKNIRNVYYCGYFSLDHKDKLTISTVSNDISSGLYNYIFSNLKSFKKLEVVNEFSKIFKKINIIRFASGLTVEELIKYLELKFINSAPVTFLFGYSRGSNVFLKMVALDEKKKKTETDLGKSLQLYPKYVEKINDSYTIGELLGLQNFFGIFLNLAFLEEYIGHKFKSIKILNDLDHFIEQERIYFDEKIGKLDYVSKQFDIYEHIVHKQKAYFKLQEYDDFEGSANEIEKSLLYSLHSDLNDKAFIKRLATFYCEAINIKRINIQLSMDNLRPLPLIEEWDLEAPLVVLSYHLTSQIKNYSIIRKIFKKLFSKYGKSIILQYFYGLSLYRRSSDKKNKKLLREAIKEFKKALEIDNNFILAKNKIFWAEIALKTDFFENNYGDILVENLKKQCKILKEFEDYFMLIGVSIRNK